MSVMAADQFAERLLSLLDVRETELIHALCIGPLPDFERAMFLRGRIAMLREAEDLIRDIIAPMIENDPFEGMHDDPGTPERFNEQARLR